MNIDSILAVIPARAGSKGIPGKNTKDLGGLPLFMHTVQFARLFLPDNQIFISTNDLELVQLAKSYDFSIPFLRPEELSTDTTSTFEVLQHVVEEINPERNRSFQGIWLLQPTSPFRLKRHGVDFIQSLSKKPSNAWVSASIAKHHPWFNLFREEAGQLVRFIEGPAATRRQDCPPALALNGSMYWFPWEQVKQARGLGDFPVIHPYIMEDLYSIDLDIPRDWMYAEWLWQTYQSELRDW